MKVFCKSSFATSESWTKSSFSIVSNIRKRFDSSYESVSKRLSSSGLLISWSIILFVRLIFLLKLLKHSSILLNSTGIYLSISTSSSSTIYLGLGFYLIVKGEKEDDRFFLEKFNPFGIKKDDFFGLDV